jgi:hypothetical protein
LILDGKVIPNVSEKPIKFLGGWIRADATDKVIIEHSKNDLGGPTMTMTIDPSDFPNGHGKDVKIGHDRNSILSSNGPGQMVKINRLFNNFNKFQQFQQKNLEL